MKLHPYLFWIAGSIGICSLAAASPAFAQPIAGDGTLSTAVTSPDGLNYSITGGSMAGANLFHSFSQFSVPAGGICFLQQSCQY
ncbi:MAG: filamentous hemagglutinin N-terminal domain-containing protein [Oscillatoria princeps RMCB-10]|jgi:large exoprotein involved in heme utilization and adhesion|nr:filamentous hemagglutinin N-terminal domain-containing protein [Oscillatoria princeps RMCB-10]